MISHANRITSWITTEILKFPTVATRRDAIVLFIHAAQALEQLQNYNGIIQVHSSLLSLLVEARRSFPLGVVVFALEHHLQAQELVGAGLQEG